MKSHLLVQNGYPVPVRVTVQQGYKVCICRADPALPRLRSWHMRRGCAVPPMNFALIKIFAGITLAYTRLADIYL